MVFILFLLYPYYIRDCDYFSNSEKENFEDMQVKNMRFVLVVNLQIAKEDNSFYSPFFFHSSFLSILFLFLPPLTHRIFFQYVPSIYFIL